MVDRVLVDSEKSVEQLLVTGIELARADVLRVVAPVAVGAHPDLEQRWLVVLHGAVACRGEGPDPRPGPDEREPECQLNLSLPAGPFAVDESQPEGGRLALLHPGLELGGDMFHRRSGDLVGESHAFDLLLGLHSASAREEGRSVDCVRECVEPPARERRRLADHAVRRLGPQRQLEPDTSVSPRGLLRGVQRTGEGRPGVVRGVSPDQRDVIGPGRLGCVLL